MSVPYGQPPVTYVPGTWTAMMLDQVALLADLPAGSVVLGSAWTALVQGAGVDGVLAALAQSDAEHPSFVLVGPSAVGGTRLVVSGTARAEVHGPKDGPVVVAAPDASGRREERVPGQPAIRLAGGTADASAVGLPLDRGVVLAAALGLGTPATVPAEVPAPDAVPEPVAPPQEPTVAEPLPAPARVSSDTMPPRGEFDSGLIDSLPWRTPESFGDAPPEPPPAEPVEPPVDPAPAPTPSWGDPQADVQDPFALNPWAGAAPPAWPEPGLPSGPPSEPVQAPTWPTPGTPPGGNWGEPAAPLSGRPAPAPDPNPWAPGGAGGQPSADPPAAPPATEAGGPAVHAFACPNQHLNPPYAGTCRICGEPIPPQEGFSAPRPQLGVLTLSTGDTVPLDRDVVLGRAPFHADENAASRPHLVQLSSPGNDISRSHVRVNLENWFVQVTDLGSTNGTVVTLPDQAPVRLRPHDPFTILPGTTVNIADEVTLRFDAS